MTKTDAVTRTLTLVLIGGSSGILVFTAGLMVLGPDLSGDTASPQLAVILAACAIVLAITGVGVATAAPWSRRLSLAVGLAGVIAGFGGLIYFLVASLIAVGSFPDVLLEPLNLTIALIMGLTGLTAAGLLMRDSDLVTTAGATRAWLVRTWHPVAAGIAIGIAAAWVWSAFVWPLIPYQCCRA